jgi:hypothetical protein
MGADDMMDVGPYDDELEFAESARLSLIQAAKDLLEHGPLTPPERELLGSVVRIFGAEGRNG